MELKDISIIVYTYVIFIHIHIRITMLEETYSQLREA